MNKIKSKNFIQKLKNQYAIGQIKRFFQFIKVCCNFVLDTG